MNETKEPFLIFLIEGVFLVFLIFVISSISYYLITNPTPTELKEPKIIVNFIEAQELDIARKSESINVIVQKTDIFESGVWSNDDHLFAYGVSKNDSLAFSLPVPEEAKYQIIVHLSKSYDYGVWTIKVNNVRAKLVDLFSTIVEPAKPIDLGVHHLIPSKNSLLFEVVGRNPKARPPYYQLGIDGIVIRRVNETP